MLLIKKGKEPESLTKYKMQHNAYYDGCNKSDIRKALLKEQGYLCAYCMKRISEKTMTIEHYKDQSSISEKYALNYNNMLGVCSGNRGNRQEKLTCDAKRGNSDLKVNPLMQQSIDVINYDGNGKIYSHDEAIDYDLDKVLNLNCKDVLLQANRKEALKSLKEMLLKSSRRGQWTRSFLTKIKNMYETPNEYGELRPYSGIVLHYINKKLRSCK